MGPPMGALEKPCSLQHKVPPYGPQMYTWNTESFHVLYCETYHYKPHITTGHLPLNRQMSNKNWQLAAAGSSW